MLVSARLLPELKKSTLFMWVVRVLLVNVVAHLIQVAVLEQSGFSERASAIANALQSNGNCSVNVRIYRTVWQFSHTTNNIQNRYYILVWFSLPLNHMLTCGNCDIHNT